MSDADLEVKARRIVSMLSGTMALEGQAQDDEFLEEMYRLTLEELRAAREAARTETEP